MLTWYVAYDDDPAVLRDDSVHEKNEDRAGMFRRFDAAAKEEMIGSRKLRGMWIIDRGTAQQDVPRAWGKYPHTLRARYAAYRRRERRES